jgi:hypothetical protein
MKEVKKEREMGKNMCRRKKEIFLISTFLCLMLASESFSAARDVGTTGMELKKILSPARPASMGNAFVAVSDDISSMFHNISGLSSLKESQFIFTHHIYVYGTWFDSIGYAIPTKVGTIGLTLSFLSFIIEEYDLHYTSTGESLVSEQLYSIGYSKRLGNFSYGCKVDIFFSRISNYTASTWGLNFGGLWFAPYDIAVGVTAENVGPQYSYQGTLFTGEKQSLPMTYKAGVMKNFVLPLGSCKAECDIVYDYILRSNIGVEWKLFNLLYIRGGYKIGYFSGGPSFGVGVEYTPKGLDRLQVDYAFIPVGNLGISHYFSVIAKF